MVDTCKKCGENIAVLKEAFKCKDCSGWFHPSCVSDTKRKVTTRTNWRCEDCTNECSSTGSRASVRESDGAVLEAIAAFRKENNERWDQQTYKLNQMQTEIVSIVKDVNDLKQSYQDLKTASEGNATELIALRDANTSLHHEVRKLKTTVADLEQHTRKSNVIITGVPITDKEDLYEILKVIARLLEIDFHYSDVSATHRLPGAGDQSRPPVIVVSFVSRATRALWVSARRRRRSLSASEVNSRFPNKPIYINEHLSQETREVFNAAREQMKDGKLTSVWTSDCRVMVKKSQTGRPFRIHSLRQAKEVGTLELPSVKDGVQAPK